VARILLAVSGGISAYKAVEFARLATRAGHAVRVIQTPSSLNFVGSASFEAITGGPVLVDQFERDPARGSYPGEPLPDHDPAIHLELVRRCDVLLVAPASANTIAKLAAGQADNLVCAAYLACRSPVAIAPAMNNNMYEHPATQANLEVMRKRGVRVIEPTTGALASWGEWGIGRLAEPQDLLAAVELVARSGTPRPLDGARVLVTAGGTREPVDAVRFLGNRSSGRMGLALAEEAVRRGAEVTVVAANVDLASSGAVSMVAVETAEDLRRATLEHFERCDVLLMAAAVADYRPAEVVDAKIDKDEATELKLELVRTPDVLAEVAERRRPDQTVVGFAAEHGPGGEERARAKLERKKLDAIVLNDVSRDDIGFEVDDNQVTIIDRRGERQLPRLPKADVAALVLDRVQELQLERAVPSKERS
jgi:phosphopantothenoylcysteine decarboxylase / phosphopantothenate---cysteine ligase